MQVDPLPASPLKLQLESGDELACITYQQHPTQSMSWLIVIDGRGLDYLEIRIERLAKARSYEQASKPSQPVLQHPVDGRGGGKATLGAHTHGQQQRLQTQDTRPHVVQAST